MPDSSPMVFLASVASEKNVVSKQSAVEETVGNGHDAWPGIAPELTGATAGRLLSPGRWERWVHPARGWGALSPVLQLCLP